MAITEQQQLEANYVMPTFARSPIEFVQGRGMTLFDSEGKQYTDFLAGIGVCSLGHAHPALTLAIQKQAQELLHVSNYFYIEHRGELAALICALAAQDPVGARACAEALSQGSAVLPETMKTTAGWQTFFANSGAEANEGAMKLARLYARRHGNKGNTIVCLRGSFHGRTLETIAATMQDRLQDQFRPLPQGFVACDPNNIEELEGIFKQMGQEICAVMFEPIQGESGVHPLTPEFCAAVRRLADEYGALLIADEVQTGIFRCGKPFAWQRLGVEPDIMSLAKGIAGGVPMGAVVARSEIASAFTPGDHGTTFGGSCLAVRAAAAVLSELVLGAYDERAVRLGAFFQAELAKVSGVTEVRGAGLMVGCDLMPGTPEAHCVVDAMLGQGFVINATGPSTLRFLPPLICEEQDIVRLIKALDKVLASRESCAIL